MKTKLKYIFITIGVMLIVGYLVFSTFYINNITNDVVCREVNINLLDGNKLQLISERDIALMLENSDLNPMGKSTHKIKSEDIENNISGNKMVKSVECYKTPAGAVFINIKQRCPKFRVVGMGSYYMDEDRKVLPVSTNFAAYIPVVSGRVTVSMAAGELFDFVSYIRDDKFWDSQIEQIYVRDDKKIELVPRVGDAIILLGTLDKYESKLEKLRKLYVYGFSEIGWNRYKTIDLQFKNQIVCTKHDLGEKHHADDAKVLNDSIIAKKI